MPLDGTRSGPLVCTPHSVRMIQRGIKRVSRRIFKQGKSGPYGIPGSHLWVRESYRQLADGSLLYRADVPDDQAIAMGPWKNVRFVPKSSARIWLTVIDVRVEPLHAITDEDAEAEGIVESEYPGFYEPGLQRNPRDSFAIAWDKINGKRAGGAYAWAQNPRVWRLEFRRIIREEE